MLKELEPLTLGHLPKNILETFRQNADIMVSVEKISNSFEVSAQKELKLKWF